MGGTSLETVQSALKLSLDTYNAASLEALASQPQAQNTILFRSIEISLDQDLQPYIAVDDTTEIGCIDEHFSPSLALAFASCEATQYVNPDQSSGYFYGFTSGQKVLLVAPCCGNTASGSGTMCISAKLENDGVADTGAQGIGPASNQSAFLTPLFSIDCVKNLLTPQLLFDPLNPLASAPGATSALANIPAENQFVIANSVIFWNCFGARGLTPKNGLCG